MKMDIASVTMEWFCDKFDIGGGPQVDEVIDSDYFYLLRLSGIYPYLRNRFWVLSLVQIISYLAILLYGMYVTINTSMQVASEDLTLAAQYAHFAILFFMATIMLLTSNKGRNKVNNIHLILRDNYYQYDDGVEIKELDSWKKDHKRMKIKLVLAITTLLLLTAFSLAGMPLIEGYFGYRRVDIKDLDMRLPWPLRHPHSKDGILTFCAYLFLCIATALISAIAVSSIDLVFIFIGFSIVFQYKILHKSIENLQLRAENIYKIRYPKKNVSEEKMLSCYMHCIKQNVEHHLKIETVFYDLFGVGYYILGFGIFLGSFIIAASLLGFIMGTSTPSVYVSAFFLLIAEIVNMGMLCYFGQQISDHNYDTVLALYNTNWPTAPKEVVTSIRIMIEKSKRPLEAKAFGLWPLNYELFTSIINTSYSYLNILLGAKSRMRLKRTSRRKY